jgi:hypothetical protein
MVEGEERQARHQGDGRQAEAGGQGRQSDIGLHGRDTDALACGMLRSLSGMAADSNPCGDEAEEPPVCAAARY